MQFVDEGQAFSGKINRDVDFSSERPDGVFGAAAKKSAQIVTNSGDKP